MKRFLKKLYILGFMCLTVVFTLIIWNVTFGHIVEEYKDRQRVLEVKKLIEAKSKSKTTFQKEILESDQTVKHYLGYRVLEEKRLEGHFHHIDFHMGPDNRSYCIGCHGDMPHDKVKELRAFGNMHAFFISCQTCHVRLEGETRTNVFKWYDRKTGEIVPPPVKRGVPPGSYAAKILPFERVDGTLQRIDTTERVEFAREYKQMENTLTEAQKTKARKIIHKIVNKKPYICQDCHQKKTPLLPFQALGYTTKRSDAIVSSEVVGMINNYTKFYMPRMLSPGEGSKK